MDNLSYGRIRAVAVAAALALATTGAHCEICEAPAVEVASANVADGEISWTKGDDSGQHALIGIADYYPISEAAPCAVRAAFGSSDGDGGGSMDSIFDDAAAYPLVVGWLELLCFNSERDERAFRVSITTDDPRDWTLGELAATTLKADVVIWSFENCGANGCAKICKLDVPSAQVTLTVDEAIGGAAPSPAGVTDDFLRKVHLELDTGAPLVGKTAAGETCAAFAASASTTFSWDRSHFSYEPGCS